MKELSIKEKAERYDKAIERANKLNYVSDKDSLQRKTVEHIFPELVENDEGRMIKSLIRLVKAFYDVNFPTPEGFERKDILVWLEKQGEQRSKLVDFDLNANDSDLQEATYFIPNGFHAEIIGDKVVIKKGEQKPVDKIEPKFKTGKWYFCVKDFWGKFVRFDKGHAYYCGLNGCLKEFDSGAHIAIDEKLYDYFNLWTIQDAKDGDVLVSESTCGINTWYCIFKSLDGDESMTVYCYLARDGRFETKKELCFDKDPFNTKPATKEQRDTLIKAMADAGYTFDFEKKELRKIEQKPAENEELTE